MPAYLTPPQIDEALALQRKCKTHEQIAEALGVHRTTVSRTLAKVNRRALKRLESRAAGTKAKQVDQLEWMASQAIEGWERSREDAETVKTVESTGEGEDATPFVKTETTVKGQAGAPVFLSEARAALADVRKILGLDAAEKVSTAQDDRPGPSTIPEDDPRFVGDGGEPTPEGPDGPDPAERTADLRAGGDG